MEFPRIPFALSRKETDMIYIAPSILAADASRLGEEVKKVEEAGAKYLHLDIMDGNFVPNISYGPHVVECLRECSKLVFDVHLMTKKPWDFIDPFIEAGADSITVHYESFKGDDSMLVDVLKSIKEQKCKTGLAISPATPYEVVLDFLPLLDMVLVMTVNPGYGGQSLIPETLDKIAPIRRAAKEKGIDLRIQVDGGINEETIWRASSQGADVFVAGSAIFKSAKPRTVINSLKAKAKEHPFIG